jgi:hypothetical protein
MNMRTAHLPPKAEQSGNVRVITFTTKETCDVENVMARDIKGCINGLGRSLSEPRMSGALNSKEGKTP